MCNYTTTTAMQNPNECNSAFDSGNITGIVIFTYVRIKYIIILVFMRQFLPKSGMGTLISTMMPYSVVFMIIWTFLLVLWMAFGFPLGPEGDLVYVLPKK